MLQVVVAGLMTTVQDSGRPDAAYLGVPIGGACDPFAFAVANLLLGNAPNAPALEMTLLGPELVALETTVVALAGADLHAVVPEEARSVHRGTCTLLRAGHRIVFGSAERGGGARAYLALPGGVDVPMVLGSAATCLVGGFGGFDGRPLQTGDKIRAAGSADVGAIGRSIPYSRYEALTAGDAPIRVLPGPNLSLLPAGALSAFLVATWRISPRSNRVGLRLEGAPLEVGPGAGDLISQPVVWGAVQVPPGGLPVLLLADCQTVGGYPVVAVAILADRPRLAQLAPGDLVSFALVDEATARLAYLEQRAALAEIGASIGTADAWDVMSEWAQ